MIWQSVVGLLRRSRHYDNLLAVLLLAQRVLLSWPRYSWRDHEALTTYLHGLQRHQLDTQAILDRPPSSVLIDINAQFEAARVGVIAILASVLSWLPAWRVRKLETEERAFRNAHLARWLPKKVRRLLLRGIRGAEVATMHSFARKAIYDLVTRNGDLNAALAGFEVLAALNSRPNSEYVALDRLMLKLLPYLISVEKGVGYPERTNSARPAIVVSVVVWGETYADLFLQYGLSSLMTPGNLPGLAKDVSVTWHIFTTAVLRTKLEKHPALSSPFNVRFEEIPEDLIDLATGDCRYWLFGGLTQTSFRLAARIGADLYFVNPSAVYSADYFSNLYKVIDPPHTQLVLTNSLRTDKRAIAAALDAQRKSDGTISLDARSLHSLGLKHLHQSSRSVFVTDTQLSAKSITSSTIFMWPEGAEVAVRSAHYQPIFVSNSLLTQNMRLSYFAVDSSVYRGWARAPSVAAATYVVRPCDDIGYLEIDSSGRFSMSNVDRNQYLREFWNTNTYSDFSMLANEFRLPIVELPAGLPDVALAPSTSEAFIRLYEDIRQARPHSDQDEDRICAKLTIAHLVAISETALGLEVREGAGPVVETLVEDLQRAVRGDHTFYAAAVDDAYLERMYINFFRLGLVDELKALCVRHKFRLDGATPVLSAFVDRCTEQFANAEEAGKEWRIIHAGTERFTLSCTVWGDEYVRNFMNFNVRSMLAPGNLPGLVKLGACKMFVVTNENGRAAIQAHPVFAQTLKYVEWEFAIVPQAIIAELVSREMEAYFYILYGMLDHIGIFYAQGAQSNLFMIPVDAIVANGSLVNMANYRSQGFECCGGGNIVANTETFLPALEKKFSGKPAITITTEDLASLAIEHAHHYFISQVISAENQDFGMHARELFWPVPGGVEIHSCFVHPLFVAASAVARYKRKHYANVDYGMIPRIFSDPNRIKIIANPDEAYISNFCTRKRRYETTGSPFDFDTFLRAHTYTYPVQKALFIHGQTLKCRYKGITTNCDVAADIDMLSKRLIGERIGF